MVDNQGGSGEGVFSGLGGLKRLKKEVFFWCFD